MIRNLSEEDRETLDNALLARPVEVGGGASPPAWWKGEEDAAESARAFLSATR